MELGLIARDRGMGLESMVRVRGYGSELLKFTII